MGRFYLSLLYTVIRRLRHLDFADYTARNW
jgi:hypothetical protein